MFRLLRLFSLTSTLTILSSCTYHASVNQLRPNEQAEFRAYSKLMSAHQSCSYLGKVTADERQMYLQQIGMAQRFATLDEADKKSILAGYIRKGMSADAVRFLWGQPTYIGGHTGHYEYWYYQGSSSDLVESGNNYSDASTEIEVYLVNGQVDWWFEGPLDDDDSSDENDFSRDQS